MTKKDKIKDIYEGKFIECWEDVQIVYLWFQWCIVTIPKKDWKEVKRELRELSEA